MKCIFQGQNLHFNNVVKNIDSLYFSVPNIFNCKFNCKVECVFPMVFVSLLTHVEFGPNYHREDAPHFTKYQKNDICIVPYSVDLHHEVINCAFSSFHPKNSWENITWFSRNHFNHFIWFMFPSNIFDYGSKSEKVHILDIGS